MSVLDELLDNIRQSNIPMAQIARKAGSYPSLLEDWVACRHSPSLSKFEKIANAAGYELVLIKKSRS